MTVDEEELKKVIFTDDLKNNLTVDLEDVLADRSLRYMIVAKNAHMPKTILHLCIVHVADFY